MSGDNQNKSTGDGTKDSVRENPDVTTTPSPGQSAVRHDGHDFQDLKAAAAALQAQAEAAKKKDK